MLQKAKVGLDSCHFFFPPYNFVGLSKVQMFQNKKLTKMNGFIVIGPIWGGEAHNFQ